MLNYQLTFSIILVKWTNNQVRVCLLHNGSSEINKFANSIFCVSATSSNFGNKSGVNIGSGSSL